MQYAKIISNGVLIKDKPTDGYKPVEESVPETRDGLIPVMHFEDSGDKIFMVWDYVEMPPVEPIDEEARLKDYENALADLGVRFGD